MSTKLDRVAEKARSDHQLRFTSLAHLLTPEFLKETWTKLNKRGAHGVDGETAREFEETLEARLQDLHERLKARRYRAPPVRRTYIPKGQGQSRPLGIPTIEDRLLQAAVARILNVLFEPLFVDFSFGYRPKRKAHDALRQVRRHLMGGRVMHVYDMDIRAYFERVNHDWLRQMLAKRVADPVIMSLVGKWLRAGVMDAGVVITRGDGVPQGGPVSPILANVYLHYVLDLWFERAVKPNCQGEAHLVRFADDAVVLFQHRSEAERFDKALKKRLEKFNLELSPEKTRLIVFGRYARERAVARGEKPDTFEFLGFTHVCGKDVKGRFAVIRKPASKSCRKFLDKTRSWLRSHMHYKVRIQQKQLTRMLTGFYQYFALNHCTATLYRVRATVRRQWRNTLRRRSQKGARKARWSHLFEQSWFDLPKPVKLHGNV